jgi:predicted dehydrogenase
MRHQGTLTVGLVGLGYWGPNLLRVLSDREDIEIAWLCDLNPVQLARSSRRFPQPRTTTRFEDLIDDDELDAIFIATPVQTHFELAQASLAAGKHTFVEKPLTPSVAQADVLISRARSDDLVLMCGLTFLYSPPVRAVKDLISRGELGHVYFVSSSRVNLGLHQKDTSVIWDLGPHDFSILTHWLDEMPTSVQAMGRDSIVPGIPDVAFVNLRYPSGILANVELSWLSPSKLRRTVVVGSEKMVVYEDGSGEPVRIFDHGVVYRDPETFGEYQLSYRSGDILSPRVDSAEPIARQLDDFVQAIQTGSEPVANAEFARDVVRLAEAADASLKASGKATELAAERAVHRRILRPDRAVAF